MPRGKPTRTNRKQMARNMNDYLREMYAARAADPNMKNTTRRNKSRSRSRSRSRSANRKH